MGTMESLFATTLLLVLFLFNPSKAATSPSSLIASIDCGAAKSYTDGRGISWVSDSGLIKTGRVETIANATSFSDAMATLRVFPTGKRNCYTLSVPTGGQFVLLRASFFYGNYDGKDSPPTFDIEFDGNRWATIQTSSDFVDIAEVIYIVSGSSIVFCVVQTNAGELPFVSAIELRALDDNMYSRFDRTAGAMVLFLRTAAGLAQPVRYPDDPYDRIWIPYQAPESLEVVQNQATSMLTNITDRPPAAILQAAVTPADGGTTIIMSSPLPSITVQAYINLYFTEVAELSIGQKRTLQVYIDNLAVSDPFVPPFGGVMEFYIANYSASSKTQIEVRPTTDSTLPTVISALESYVIVPLSGGSAASNLPPSDIAPSDLTPSDTAPSDLPPTDIAPSDVPPSDTEPSDSPTVVGDQTKSPPAKNTPVSIFGGGQRGKPSLGNKVKANRFAGIGAGLVFPLLWMVIL